VKTTLCRTCPADIIVARLSTSGEWGVFDATPVPELIRDRYRHWHLSGIHARPVGLLIEQLQISGEVADDEAVLMARTRYAWHQFHECPNRPSSDAQEPTP